MESGGRAAKLGNSYERRWAVHQALLVIAGRSQSLLWEPLGLDENGVDLWVTASDGHKTGYQLKRQNRSKEYWSVADLRAEGVLQYAFEQLVRDIDARYVFVSSCGVRHLRDLAEQSRRANNDATVFFRDLVCTNKDRQKSFHELLSAWGLNPDLTADRKRAFHLLQRMEFWAQERARCEREQVEFAAGLLLDGIPAKAVSSIGDFLDDNLGNDLHADELRAELEKRGFQFRNLAGDPSLPSAIDHLQERFDAAIADNLIAGVPIPRPEVADLATRIKGPESPRMIFVHGQAGSGKTVVVHQLFKTLRSSGVPCLPIQLHVRRPAGTPRSFAQSKLGLPASPATSLRGLAGDRHAVLLLDQLDALRLTSIHSHEAWEACAALIAEALTDPRTTVVVACRTFDLENDPNIAAWKKRFHDQSSNPAVDLTVGDLPEQAVSDLLDQHATSYASLPDRQRKLLRQPASLALWWDLASAGQTPIQFTNATQLMREVLKLRRIEAARDHSASTEDLNQVITKLVIYMESRGRLDAPESLVAERINAVNALCSVGLVKRDDGKLTFAHQGYFDHLVAEQVLSRALQDDDDPSRWLKSNQSLFRRDQLRQLLTLLREADAVLHNKLLRTVLLDSSVRFHLKHLVLGLLSQADPPLEYEVRLIVELAEDPSWWEHIQAVVLWSKAPWFDALHRDGHLAGWLAKWTDEEAIRMLLGFFRPFVSHRGEQIDELLAPYWNAGGSWDRHLEPVFWTDPSNDSPGMSALRLERIRSGRWKIDDLYLDRIAEHCPTRLVPLLAAVIEAWIDRIRGYMRGVGDAELPRWPLRDDSLDRKVLDAIRADSNNAWPIFSDTLRLLSTLRRLANRRRRKTKNCANRDYGLSRALDSACESIERLVVASVEGLAVQEPSQSATLLCTLSGSKVRGLEHAIARGLAYGHDGLADAALSWLYASPSRFRLGDGYHEIQWEPARALIARFSPNCSEAVFERLEKAILAYHDAWERRSIELQLEYLRENRIRRNDFGRAQNVLLAALPVARMSDRGCLVSSGWRAKFGDPAEEKPLNHWSTGGWVTSPIPPDKLMFVSDRVWLQIIGKEWPESGAGHWRQHGPDVVGEASPRHFAEALGTAAKGNPQRFAALALKIPRNSDPRFFTSILQALGQSVKDSSLEPIKTEELEAIIAHVGGCNDAEYVLTLCRIVESHREARWSDDVVDRVLSYVDHPEPVPSVFTVHKGADANGESEPDVGMTAINCVRGCVAGAVRHLLWANPDAYDKLVLAVKQLLADPHPSVRYEALGACLPILEPDKSLAVRMAVAGCDHEDDRVLQSRWLDEIIRFGRATHLDQLAPIIERMAKSTVDRVAKSGAAWVTACWLDGGRFAGVVTECRSGSKSQRLGVTIAATDYLARAGTSDVARSIVLDAFSDSDHEIRTQAAGYFMYDEVLSAPKTVELAIAFVQSSEFLNDPGHLLQPLSEFTGDLTTYSSVVLGAVDAVCEHLADQTRDRTRWSAFAGNEASTLLIRLYEIAYGAADDALQAQCLDRWDAMLRSRVGLTADHLKQLDD